ncbi:HIRA-interacting protein 5 [Microthyrium microscopicum]|uniref:HIRA-interacting protein 5 n=1 Tax=Microthyrium microscopicum TaxID=703497 RepID=A0A6A6U7S6_9PEZI|nr:HIRA-interacting protein 5 [Microthyrium microscopicum]
MASRSLSQSVARSVRSIRPSTAIARSVRTCQCPAAVRQIHITSSNPLRPSYRQLRPVTSSICQPQKRTLFIQTEDTPNPDALKFKPNQRVLPDPFPSPYVEYLSPRSTITPPYPSPLAAQLLAIDGVTGVFFGSDYITISKDAGAQWAHVKPEAFSLITEAVTSGQPMVTIKESEDGVEEEADSLAYNENDSEVVGMIKELLETRIRPAIQDDGGDIEFRGFENGQVYLKLRGACRTCDSSTVTLRNGIESMLMHYIEEVQGVQQAFDQEEEVAMQEFQKFEERLRAQQGYVPASTTGKGTLDTVEG